MRITWRTEWPNWLLLAAMFLWVVFGWDSAPERFPVHWNLAGEADRYGSRAEGMLGLPLVALGLYLLLLFLPRLDPGRANYRHFAGAYATLRLALTAFLVGIDAMIQLVARGYPVGVDVVGLILLGGLFVAIGSTLDQLRPNWFVGIRTPWTLSSQTAWTQTHRLGRWLFSAMGLALIAAGVIRAPWAFLLAAGVVLGSVVGMVVYSYLVWRRASDRVPPAGLTSR